jgi:hypothetical protein
MSTAREQAATELETQTAGYSAASWGNVDCLRGPDGDQSSKVKERGSLQKSHVKQIPAHVRRKKPATPDRPSQPPQHVLIARALLGVAERRNQPYLLARRARHGGSAVLYQYRNCLWRTVDDLSFAIREVADGLLGFFEDAVPGLSCRQSPSPRDDK